MLGSGKAIDEDSGFDEDNVMVREALKGQALPVDLPLPSEDVEGYVKATLLRYVRSGLEALLRAAAENGEIAKTPDKGDKSVKKKKCQSSSPEEASTMDEKGLVNGPAAPFNPLVWLSDHLRQHAQSPRGRYREMFEARMAEVRAQKEAEALKA